MNRQGGSTRWLSRALRSVAVVLAAVIGMFTAAPAPAALVTYAYDTVAYTYDGPALLSSPDIVASYARGSPSGREPGSWVNPASVRDGGVAADTAPNLVYRGLAAGEDAMAGLVARAPGATGVSPISHVAGKIQSPWISTTKSMEVAAGKYGGNGGVAIDLNKVTSEVVDISGGFPNGGRFSSWAIADQEVLIRGSVPPEAIEGKW